MKNPIIATAYFGPVYKRKIHFYIAGPIASAPGQRWGYAGSTNAYRTCRDAVAALTVKNPGLTFKANFAKD